jgi:hypothetical protein
MPKSESILALGWALAQQLNLPTRGQIMQPRPPGCSPHAHLQETVIIIHPRLVPMSGVASPKGFPTQPTIKMQTAHGMPYLLVI